jgi:hypothetical protein
LERALEQILSAPDSDVGDVLRALWGLLGVSNAPLDLAMTNFIHDLIVECFTRYRTRYLSSNHEWMISALKRRPTEAQAYLALIALPQSLLGATQEDILAALAGSNFLADVRRRFVVAL